MNRAEQNLMKAQVLADVYSFLLQKAENEGSWDYGYYGDKVKEANEKIDNIHASAKENGEPVDEEEITSIKNDIMRWDNEMERIDEKRRFIKSFAEKLLDKMA